MGKVSLLSFSGPQTLQNKLNLGRHDQLCVRDTENDKQSFLFGGD